MRQSKKELVWVVEADQKKNRLGLSSRCLEVEGAEDRYCEEETCCCDGKETNEY